jgi:peptidyl-prolyl cis-trans isomerase D
VGAEAARAKIEEVHRRLSAGGVDFADLARRRSEDASAADGGDLGWVGQGELVPALSKAAFSLAAGEISGVIETELGFHVVQVTEVRPGGLVPYELVRELLFQELVGERAVYFAESAREDRDRLMTEHAVEIFAERLPW